MRITLIQLWQTISNIQSPPRTPRPAHHHLERRLRRRRSHHELARILRRRKTSWRVKFCWSTLWSVVVLCDSVLIYLLMPVPLWDQTRLAIQDHVMSWRGFKLLSKSSATDLLIPFKATMSAKHVSSVVSHSLKWLRLERITYVDQEGKERQWEMASRTTRWGNTEEKYASIFWI